MGRQVGSRSDVECANGLCASAESGCNSQIHSRAQASRTEARASRAEARASHAERRASQHAE
eukprot:497510-Pleurochrysis_carterae.AAC.1